MFCRSIEMYRRRGPKSVWESLSECSWVVEKYSYTTRTDKRRIYGDSLWVNWKWWIDLCVDVMVKWGGRKSRKSVIRFSREVFCSTKRGDLINRGGRLWGIQGNCDRYLWKRHRTWAVCDCVVWWRPPGSQTLNFSEVSPISRLEQSAVRLYFRPVESDVRHILDVLGSKDKKVWAEKLRRLEIGEFVLSGYFRLGGLGKADDPIIVKAEKFKIDET